MARAGHGTGNVLWPDRLVDPDRVITRESLQPAREERLERQVAAVLLPDEHDERRAVHPRGRESADGVAEPGSRMEDRERRLVAPDRPSGRHADDRALVQRKHEAQIVRQVCEQLDLGRARVREQRRQTSLAEDVERRVADGAGGHGAILLQMI